MKKDLLAAAMAAMFAMPALAQAPKHEHGARHGGVFVEGKEADYELVAKSDTLVLYVADHGKPMDVSRASARLTLLSGAQKQDVELKPAGDKLEARGSFRLGAGTKAVAVVSNGGKTLGTARFTLK